MREDDRFVGQLREALDRYAARVPDRSDPAEIVDRLERDGMLRRPRVDVGARVGQRWARRLRIVAVLAAAAALIATGAFIGSRRSSPPTPLAIGTEGGLMLATGDGVIVRTLEAGAHRDPRWSPDDRWLSGIGPDGSVVVLEANGTTRRTVNAAAYAWRMDPSGAPNLVVRRDDGTIAVLDPEHGDVREIPVETPATGAIAATADRIAWVAGPEIYVAERTGAALGPARLVTRTTRTTILQLALSPSGDDVAWIAADCLGTCLASLSVITLDGSAPRTLDGSIDTRSTLTWDPSGSTLLVLRDAGPPAVAMVDADDGKVTPVVDVAVFGAEVLVRPRWSAHGTAILVESGPSDIDAPFSKELWRLDADGGGLRRLATDTSGGDLGVTP